MHNTIACQSKDMISDTYFLLRFHPEKDMKYHCLVYLSSQN